MINFINNYLQNTNPNSTYARTYQLIVTDNCNMNCTYCFEHFNDTNTNMTFETAKKIIDNACKKEKEINDGQKFRIHFFGGEPFLNPILITQILDYMNNEYSLLHYTFSVATNGTLYNDDIMNDIVKYKDKIHFAISLDGRKEVQNINRANYELIIKNIKKYQAEGFSLQITSTFTEKTIKYLYDSFYHTVNDLGINTFKYILNLDNEIWADNNIIEVFNNQINKICDYLIIDQRYNHIKVSNFHYNCFRQMQGDYICNNLNKNISYDYKGNAYNCFIFKNLDQKDIYTLGNINNSIKNKNEEVKRINNINISSIYNECISCPISAGCTRCPIVNLTNVGNQIALCHIHKTELSVFKRLLAAVTKNIK